ncbi:hypothetical protein GCM10028774_25310 [Spirosoma jeollabukense]
MNKSQRFDYLFADTWPGKYHLLAEAISLLNPGNQPAAGEDASFPGEIKILIYCPFLASVALVSMAGKVV